MQHATSDDASKIEQQQLMGGDGQINYKVDRPARIIISDIFGVGRVLRFGVRTPPTKNVWWGNQQGILGVGNS